MSALGFRVELQKLINRESRENGSNTPDFILAEYLAQCLVAFDHAVQAREQHYARPFHSFEKPSTQETRPDPTVCDNCRAPTHGALKECPYPRLPIGCVGGRAEHVDVVTVSNGNTFRTECRACGSWQQITNDHV